MTTIIWDPATKTLAADTQMTANNEIMRCHKIRKIGRDMWVANAGDVCNAHKAIEWLKAGLDEESKPEFKEGDFCLLIVDKKGTRVRHLNSEGWLWEYDSNDIVAEGSGGPYAMGALLAGADVETALRAAATKDIFTSEPFDIIRIE